MWIAHLSDLHLLGSGTVPLRRFLNKRLTGYANLKWRRHAIHKSFVAQAIAQELTKRKIDHVVITGDVSNLAFEHEFEAVQSFLQQDLGFSSTQVSIVPGNHDLYTSGSARTKRFASHFANYLQTDLPEVVSTDHPAGPFPYVHLREHVALIGLATAVPQLPLVAAGKIGKAQLQALSLILKHPEVLKRFPIILQHHPLTNPPSFWKTALNGLWDARTLHSVLQELPQALLLHGHLHTRVHKKLPTRQGSIDMVGATSASLIHSHVHRMAGFNLYHIPDNNTLSTVQAVVLDIDEQNFKEQTIPLHPIA